jgi:hypothetical protein
MYQVATQGHESGKGSRGQAREIEDLLDLLVEIALSRLVVDETMTSTTIESENDNENCHLCTLFD